MANPPQTCVFLQVEALENLFFFGVDKKQEDLFLPKWRNTDVATGMKWIERDSPQTNTAALH